jgi:hypothetical protein
MTRQIKRSPDHPSISASTFESDAAARCVEDNEIARYVWICGLLLFSVICV